MTVFTDGLLTWQADQQIPAGWSAPVHITSFLGEDLNKLRQSGAEIRLHNEYAYASADQTGVCLNFTPEYQSRSIKKAPFAMAIDHMWLWYDSMDRQLVVNCSHVDLTIYDSAFDLLDSVSDVLECVQMFCADIEVPLGDQVYVMLRKKNDQVYTVTIMSGQTDEQPKIFDIFGSSLLELLENLKISLKHGIQAFFEHRVRRERIPWEEQERET